MRGILMSLGVVLHTCAAFSATKYWLVTYPESIPWADSVNEVIHFFRMPLFFAISGLFAVILLNKLSSLKFLRNKLMRIGLPLVSAFVVLILPQQSLINHLHLNSSLQINQLPLISHLWFLINLLVYFISSSLEFCLWFFCIWSLIFKCIFHNFWINLKAEEIPSSDHWTSFSGGLSDNMNSQT